jgi:dienelactone hydrolase
LILHGADDPFVKEDEVAAFEEEMKAAEAKYELIAYPEAQHAFTNPAQDGVKLPGAKYNEYADKASNEAMLKLFAKLFEKKE